MAGRQTLDDVRAALATGSAWSGRLALCGPADTVVAVDGAIASFTLPSGEPGVFVGTLRDATREEHLQAELQRSERLKAVGTLASGIAHDFNNLLTPILGASELAATTDDAELRSHYLQSVRDAALRAAELVQRVRSFSRDQMAEAVDFNLGEVVGEVVELVRHTGPDDVTIEWSVPDEELVVHSDPSQIHRMIMNLATNALQAMADGGGRLTIELSERPAVERDDGGVAELVISDTGVGIDDDAKFRLFESYYSTRAPSGGTGLGLFTVVGILDSLGGEIDVHSEHLVGTSVHVTLPLADRAAVSGGVAEDGRPTASEGSAARILLVDDDPAVLEVVRSILTDLGHDVTGCQAADEALSALDLDPSFDLLVTDLGMPAMRGDELARIARGRRPVLPVVILSGHFDTDGLEPDWVVVTKPVPIATLEQVVGDLITGVRR